MAIQKNVIIAFLFGAVFSLITISTSAYSQGVTEKLLAPKNGESFIVIEATAKNDLEIDDIITRIRSEALAANPDYVPSEEMLKSLALGYKHDSQDVNFDIPWATPSFGKMKIRRNMIYINDKEHNRKYYYYPVSAGKTYLYGIVIRGAWMVNWAKNTKFFDIPPNSFVYLGGLDASDSRLELYGEVAAQKMPSNMTCPASGCGIMVKCNSKIHGYTPPKADGSDIAAANAFFSQKLGKEVHFQTVEAKDSPYVTGGIDWTYPLWSCVK